MPRRKAPPAPKRYETRGRPSFEPTEETRVTVRDLSAAGYGINEIAENIGVAPKTLLKHFRYELDHAREDLIKLAVNKLAAALAKDAPWAICFTLKTQGKALGWTERQEHTGKDGAPLIPTDFSKVLGGLSDDQLKVIAQAQRLLAGVAASSSGSEGIGSESAGA